MCIDVLPTCVSVHHVCAWCVRRCQKALDPLGVELEMGSVRAAGVLNYWALSLAFLSPDMAELCSPVLPPASETENLKSNYIAHTGLEFKIPSFSAPWVLALKTGAVMPSFTSASFWRCSPLPLSDHGHFHLWILDKLGSCEERRVTAASAFRRSYKSSKFQATSLYSLVSFLHAPSLKFKFKMREYDLKMFEISTILFWNQVIKYLFIILNCPWNKKGFTYY